ncbi:MAG: hypothetical protein M0031_06500 [Thermaerobacter sp.]|jgi:hypothetical protein|nr:hypothetical protein [Thermaerobacter sp.]
MPRSVWFAILAVAILGGGAAVLLWPRPVAAPPHAKTPASTTSPSSPAAPSFQKHGHSRLPQNGKIRDPFDLVRAYFTAVAAGDYRQAYAYFSPNLQKSESYASFKANFAGVTAVSYHAASVERNVVGGGNFTFIFQVPYTVTRASGSAAYTARLRCVDLSGGVGTPQWRIESLTLTPTGTS